MKRLVALSLLALSLALAQMPAYPENTLGLGYAPDKGVYLQGSALLPSSRESLSVSRMRARGWSSRRRKGPRGL